MPTTRPRYTVTDTGALADMLDLAQRRWPEVTDRRQLLLHLAEVGRDAIADGVAAVDRAHRVDAQRAALARASDLVDRQALLADRAWT